MYHDVIMAGFGGQGILLIGDMLAQAGMMMGLNVTWMPSYGVEMRGGTANTTVVVSDRRIGSPITGRPHSVIAMNGPSMDKFSNWVRPDGLMVVNSSMADEAEFKRDDVNALFMPCMDLAAEVGADRAASMTALGAFVEKTGVVTIDALGDALESYLTGKKAKFVPMNKAAIERGAQFARDGR